VRDFLPKFREIRFRIPIEYSFGYQINATTMASTAAAAPQLQKKLKAF
jgi:hypothetical protein